MIWLNLKIKDGRNAEGNKNKNSFIFEIIFKSMRGYIRRAFYTTLDIGAGKERKMFLLDKSGNKISFWNDVALKPPVSPSDVFNAVIEIPRYTIAKLELARDVRHHPLMHDLIKNKFNPAVTELRNYAQFGFFNYGFFPQTWENILTPNPEIENLLVSFHEFFKK